jgi:voltage-gated potassium channel
MTATLIRLVIAAIVLLFLWFVAWLTSYPTASLLAALLIGALWGFTLLLALLPAVAIYAPDYKARIRFGLGRFFAQFNPSKPQILGYVALSYLMTIYLFAVIFRTICNFDSNAFNPIINSIWDAAYFSIVTLASVGYGDILPVSGLARLMVSVEILSGVAYGVFFLSVVASFLRER